MRSLAVIAALFLAALLGGCGLLPEVKDETVGWSANKLYAEAKEAMNRFKMEAANEVGVNLKQGYNGDLTSRQAGSVGGQMVKKMIKSYEESMK